MTATHTGYQLSQLNQLHSLGTASPSKRYDDIELVPLAEGLRRARGRTTSPSMLLVHLPRDPYANIRPAGDSICCMKSAPWLSGHMNNSAG